MQCSAVGGARCDVSTVDMQFRTPLHWAAVLGLTEVVGTLIERGADPNLADSVGATGLHYAVSEREENSRHLYLLTSPTISHPLS